MIPPPIRRVYEPPSPEDGERARPRPERSHAAVLADERLGHADQRLRLLTEEPRGLDLFFEGGLSRPGQRRRGEGLLQERRVGREHAVADHGIVGVAGHVEHRQPRAERLHLLREQSPAQLGHDHVGEQQSDLSGV